MKTINELRCNHCQTPLEIPGGQVLLETFALLIDAGRTPPPVEIKCQSCGSNYIYQHPMSKKVPSAIAIGDGATAVGAGGVNLAGATVGGSVVTGDVEVTEDFVGGGGSIVTGTVKARNFYGGDKR